MNEGDDNKRIKEYFEKIINEKDKELKEKLFNNFIITSVYCTENYITDNENYILFLFLEGNI
jgi:hypothetical protein